MATTLISIIMPVYNCGSYVREAIQSILNQTFQDFELIIIDSTPNEESRKIISSFNDPRITYLKFNEIGISIALNYGLSLANGNMIARMDGDDISTKDRLQKQYDFLTQNKDVHLIGTNFYYINEYGKKLFYKRFPEHHEEIEFSMPILISVLHPTILTYKEVLMEVGKYNEKYTDSEDNELFLRMIDKGFKMHNLQEPLYFYRTRVKTKKLLVSQKRNAHKLGSEYLTRYYAGKNGKKSCFDKNLRFGLLEYYNGSIIKSRRYFLTCIRISPLRFEKIVRYLPFTLFGDKIFKNIRDKEITSGVNRFINKTFKIDTYKIRS